MNGGPGAAEEHVDERSTDEHYGRNGGVGVGGGGRVLTSKARGGSAVGATTYFADYQQVNCEYRQRQNYVHYGEYVQQFVDVGRDEV